MDGFVYIRCVSGLAAIGSGLPHFMIAGFTVPYEKAYCHCITVLKSSSVGLDLLNTISLLHCV